MKSDRVSKVNPANLVTLIRVLLSPIFAIAFLNADSPTEKIVVLAVAAIMEISDLADGLIARRLKVINDTGKLLDPIADSVSRFTVFLCFFACGYAKIWMLLVIFYRDVLVAAIRLFGIQKRQVIAARVSGKIKALVQGFGIMIILIIWAFLPDTTCYRRVISDLMLIITIYTAWTTIDYFYANRKILDGLIRQE